MNLIIPQRLYVKAMRKLPLLWSMALSIGFLTSMTAQVNVSITSTDPTCAGYTNGIAVATATNGTAPYTYVWNGTTSGNTLSGLAAGTYTVVATDAANRTGTATVTLTSPTAVNSTVSFASICTGGNVTVTGTGGTAPYTYNWGAGRTGSTQTGLTTGGYNVTITDNKGCANTRYVFVPGAFSTTLRIGELVCFGDCDAAIDALPQGGTAPFRYLWNTGATTQSIVGIPSGTYSVVVTDANGCTSTATGTVINPPVINLSVVIAAPACGGGANGSATATATGGRPPFTYLWSNGQRTATATGLAVGNYFVTATDSKGCNKSIPVVVPSNAGFNINIVKTDAACGTNNGSATASVTGGGTAPFSYAWNTTPIRTTASINGLGAGTYTVTVTDASGCSAVASTTVNARGSLSITVAKTDGACGITNGTAAVTVVTGTAPFTYLWSTGATTSSVSLLGAGSYTVTVTDATGCTAIGSATISLSSSITVNVDARNVNCFGGSNGSATAMVMGGSAPYTYTWSNGGNVAVIANLPIGTYTVTVRDAGGCTGMRTVTITQPTAINIALTNTTAACGAANGTAAATVSGGTAPYTYAWTNGMTTANISNLDGGVYTVVVTDARGCTATNSTTVGSTAGPNVTVATTNVACNGQSNGTATATVTGASGTVTYLWSNGLTTATVSNLAAGSYSVIVTDSRNCPVKRLFTITEPVALTLTTATTNAACGANNGTATVTATGANGGYTYAWSNGAFIATAMNLAAGTYSVVVTDSRGCSANASVTVTATAGPTVSLTPNNLTCNGLANGSITANVTGASGTITYIWNTGATTATISNLTAGTYSVTVTDSRNCPVVRSTTITQPTAISVTTTATAAMCGASNGTAAVTVSGGTAPYTYAWSNGSTATTLSGLTGGSYTVVVTDARGCTATSTTTVTTTSGATVTIVGTHPRCNGNATGSLTATVTNAVGTVTYAWSNGRNTATITGLIAGTYSVTVTDSRNCPSSQQFTLTEPTAIVATLLITNASCGGTNGSISVTVSGGTPQYSYAWSNGGTTASISGLSANNYSLTVTDANGCSTGITGAVGTSARPNVTITTVNVSCFGATDGRLTAAATGGTAPYTYLWSNNSTTNQITGLTAATYSVVVTDAAGCSATSSATVSQPTAITAVTNITNATCLPVGSIMIIPSGGTAPYTYAWATGQTTATLSNLAGGTYTVTITDANNCRNVQIVNVPAVTATNLVCNVAVTKPISILNGTDGEARVTASGGTSPYTYRWSNTQITQTATGLGAGIVSVTVTDRNGCTTICTATLTNPACVNVTVFGTIVGNQHFCQPSEVLGITEATPASGGSTAALEFLWMYSTSSIDFNTTDWAIIPNATGKDLLASQIPTLYGTTYFIRCVRRAACIEYKESNVVTKTAEVNLGWTGPTVPCLNQNSTFVADDSGPGAAYAWTFTGANITQSFARTVTVRFTTAGNQFVRLMVTNATGTCSKTRRDGVNVVSCLTGFGNILGFSAQPVGSAEVQLNFATIDEQSQSQYIIEKAIDGIHFTTIGKIASQNQNNNQYRFIDKEAKKGHSSYRVRHVTLVNEELQTSKTEKVMMAEKNEEIIAYPNPMNSSVFVEVVNGENTEGVIEIYNQVGMMVKAQKFTPDQIRYEIQTDALSPGQYVIKVRRNSGAVSTMKINKM